MPEEQGTYEIEPVEWPYKIVCDSQEGGKAKIVACKQVASEQRSRALSHHHSQP